MKFSMLIEKTKKPVTNSTIGIKTTSSQSINSGKKILISNKINAIKPEIINVEIQAICRGVAFFITKDTN